MAVSEGLRDKREGKLLPLYKRAREVPEVRKELPKSGLAPGLARPFTVHRSLDNTRWRLQCIMNKSCQVKVTLFAQ